MNCHSLIAVTALWICACSAPPLTSAQRAELERVDRLVTQTEAQYAQPHSDLLVSSDPQQKKAAFFDYLRPAVEAQNARVGADRIKLQSIMASTADEQPLTEPQQRWLSDLVARYKVDGDADLPAQLAELSRRVDIIPVALALVQAANESAWGTSRFATEGNNYFGQWCFQPGCGLVPAARVAGAEHEVARFRTPYLSVEAYFANINTHPAYRQLREIRYRLRQQDARITAVALAGGLNNYSERGESYVEELVSMIRSNLEQIQG